MGKNRLKPQEESVVEPEIIEEPKKEKKVKAPKEKTEQKSKSEYSVIGILKGLLDGTFLTRSIVIKSIPMILLLVLLGIVFITNRYYIESTSLEINKLKKEVETLRIRQIYFKNEYQKSSSITEIESALGDSSEVKNVKGPTYKILIKEEE